MEPAEKGLVISMTKYLEKRRHQKKYDNSIPPSVQLDESEDINEKIERIKASINRINQLMKELKDISDGENQNPY